MDTIQIKVNDYYGNPSYYSVMPESIFDALELASLKGEELATVERTMKNPKPYCPILPEHGFNMLICVPMGTLWIYQTPGIAHIMNLPIPIYSRNTP